VKGDLGIGVVEVVFLLCIALCFWRRLWIALGVLVAVIAGSNALFFLTDAKAWALFAAFGGVFFMFPAAVYLNLEGREKEDRRKSIRRSRRRTGRV